MKELEATLTLRNNLLKERRINLGMTQGQTALAIGVAIGTYNSYETLRKNPLTPGGNWSPSAVAISEYFDVSPDELWPGTILAVEVSRMSKTLDGWEARKLVSSDSVVRSLPPDVAIDMRDQMQRINATEAMIVASTSKRDQDMWRMYKDGISAADIAKHYGLTNERISQLLKRTALKIRSSIRRGDGRVGIGRGLRHVNELASALAY